MFYPHDQPTMLVGPETPDYEKIQALFWLGQCGCCSENHGTVYPMGSLLTQYFPYEKHLKSRNPALNIS